MPEIAGEGAEYVDPFDTEAMAVHMTKLLTDPDGLARLRQRGLASARRYSWDASARALLSVFEEVA